MTPMTPSRRLAWTAILFAISLVFLAIAAATHEVWPLFVGWIPLLGVPWLLTRPEVDAGAHAGRGVPAGNDADGRDAPDGDVTQDEGVPSVEDEAPPAEPDGASEV